ncbi:DMT family transporter [Enterovibrio calviensis]|uniref:DMT family transporter n=1 Tax=Enterovibrio calviensis TaxID=91359 RepID=UPI0037351D3E
MKRTFLNMDSALQGSLAILLSSVLWGTTGTVANFAPQISSLAIGAFAAGIGGLLLAITARKSLRQDGQLLLQHRTTLLIGAIALAVYPLAFYSSMRLAGVAVGTVVSIACAPFMTVIIERLFGKASAITPRWLLSVVLGTIGIVMLTFAESSHAQTATQQSDKLFGVMLGLLAALTYAIYAWVAKRLIENGVQSESAMGGIFGLGAMLLLPTLMFTGEHLFSSLSNTLVVTYMALIPMFLGYLIFGFGLRHVNASKATLLTLFEPVVAACFAVWIVGEIIPMQGWVGMGLIMVCLVIQASEKGSTHRVQVTD